MKIMQRKYICRNGVVETTRFPVGDNTRTHKWKTVKTASQKEQDNARQAVRVTARAINNNFCQDDLWITLTYDDESHDRLFAGLDENETLLAAREQMPAFLRRLKRKCPGIKYLYVTADMDGETGEAVRVHHHLIIAGASQEAIMKAWKAGGADCKHLYRQDDYTPLAVYLHRQCRRIGSEQLICSSKNMEQCQIQEEVLEGYQENEIRVQPGAKVLDRGNYHAGQLVQYVRYKRRPKQPKRGGHKLGSPEGGSKNGI